MGGTNMTEWKSQTGNGKYSIQFETTRYDFYKMVEKACQKAINKERKEISKDPVLYVDY